MTAKTHAPSSPEPAVVKAHGAADLLSLVPLLIGCRPRDSVVLVPFAGARAAGGLRLDLPAEGLSADEALHDIKDRRPAVDIYTGYVTLLRQAAGVPSAEEIWDMFTQAGHEETDDTL